MFFKSGQRSEFLILWGFFLFQHPFLCAELAFSNHPDKVFRQNQQCFPPCLKKSSRWVENPSESLWVRPRGKATAALKPMQIKCFQGIVKATLAESRSPIFTESVAAVKAPTAVPGLLLVPVPLCASCLPGPWDGGGTLKTPFHLRGRGQSERNAVLSDFPSPQNPTEGCCYRMKEREKCVAGGKTTITASAPKRENILFEQKRCPFASSSSPTAEWKCGY